MAFTNNNKLRPIVIKAIAESSAPDADRSVAWNTIILLGKRLDQLDADIRFAQKEKQRVLKLRSNLLDTFPEGDES